MSELYPPMTPPYGFKLKREHFTYHEMNGSPWAQCAKHDDVYQECLDSGGFAIGDDCVGCVVEDQIVKLLESDKRLHSYFYAEQFLKLGASVLPFVETHAKDCPGCDLIALIKGSN